MSDIISQFKALKLHGMAECYAEIQVQNPELIDFGSLDTPPIAGSRSHGSKYTDDSLSNGLSQISDSPGFLRF